MSSEFMVIGVLALAGAIVLSVRIAIVTTRAAKARSASEQRRTDHEHHLGERERHLTELEQHLTELEQHLAERERRAGDREQRLDAELTRLETRRQDIEDARRELERDRHELDKDRTAHVRELERIAELTAAQARRELVAVIENQAKREAALIARDIEHRARRDANKRARGIVAAVIQRVASEQTTESAVTVLRLPDDELKGRIIGREGRNIRAFEAVTGVNVVIDDTPEQVQLSCFDPQRREVARLTLEQLIADGRIHPLRIEEAYERSRAEAEELTARAAEEALIQLGITDMHPELTSMLGRLRYRTSYGQNVLKHLVEAAHIAGMMASELG
ncbi:MAG TPA: Rnase Y domain-containing protein, partial [Streptosporangiaceae bacterium]|nr:Rnase Y domain-containing protein [Streptosporangiaceae bacterium]